MNTDGDDKLNDNNDGSLQSSKNFEKYPGYLILYQSFECNMMRSHEEKTKRKNI